MTVRWAIFGAVIGAILGSMITAGTLFYTSTKARQESTARELLSEVIALVSLQEGWLLQGEGSQIRKVVRQSGTFGNAKWLRSLALARRDQGNSGRSPMEFPARSELRLHARAQGLDRQKPNNA